MNREQKIAWCFIVAFGASFIISLIVVAILHLKIGMPRALAGFALMGLTALAGPAPLLIRRDPGPVTSDERERLINRRAALMGFAGSYLFVGLACMIPFCVLGPTATISVTWLPQIFIGTGLICFLVRSLAIVIQYGAGGGHAR